MKQQVGWDTLLFSNVLLAAPVTFSFFVLGWLCADGLIHCYSEQSLDLIGDLSRTNQQEELQRSLSHGAAMSGFVIAEVCFVLKFLDRGESPWPLFPFRLRIRLTSAVILSLCAGGLLWLAVAQRQMQDPGQWVRGWPFFYLYHYDGSPADSRPPQNYYMFGNMVVDVLFCSVLLLIVLVIVECICSHGKRSAAKQATPPET